MNEQQTLELKMKTTAQEATAKIDTLVKSLTSVENVLTNIYLDLGHIEKKSESSVQKTTKQVNSLGKSVNKASQGISKLTKMLSIGAMVVGTKKIATTVKDNLEEAMECSEALNLFNVVFKNVEKNGVTAFSNIGKEAIRFQNKLGEAFGTSSTQTLTYQALYQSMAENMGISDDKAGIMSETTVKLINDLSSLYNKSEESVANALSSGIYAGQVRPLRTYGIDLTQNSLQPVLDSLGIDRAVGSLSQAEKQILRYVAVVRQSGVAHADWASTIESPSNQLKILGNQAKEAKIAVSSLFIGTFAKVLPYANAFLMVVKEVSKAIATMFGIKLEDYNSGIASTEDSFVDLEDSVDGAIGKVKELKRQTLGFDELHTINKDSGSGGSSGTSVSGGIDQRLLDAIKGYDNGMDSVKMKATEIRDKIMEWLGFTKEIDELTGEVRFKFTDTDSTLYKVVEALKKIYDNGKKVIAEVLTKIKDDFDNGAFGQVIVWILERIGDVLEFIANNQAAVDVIAHIVESLILMKGLSFAGQVTGITKIGTALTNLKGSTETAIGKAGAGKTAVGATGLLGTLGILVALTEVNWIVSVTMEGAEAIQKEVEATNNTATTLTGNTKDLTKNLIELAQAGKADTKEFKAYINVLKNNIRENYNSASSIKKQLDSSNLLESGLNRLSGRTDNLTASQNNLISTNENSVAIMESLYQQGLITDEMYNDFILTVGRAKSQYEDTDKSLGMSGTILNMFSNVTKEAKAQIEQLNGAFGVSKINADELTSSYTFNKLAMKKLHEQGLINDEEYGKFTTTVSWLKSSFDELSGKVDTSEKSFSTAFGTISTTKNGIKGLSTAVGIGSINVDELNKNINNLKGKKVEVTVDTSQAKKAIDDLIKKMQFSNPKYNITGSIMGGLKADGGIFSHGSWKDIQQYANGGAPSHGSMFVAGENGAEIVGHINGRTEVLNQSQMASAIYEAVVSAMSNAPLNVNVEVTGESRITDDQIVTMYESGKSKRGYDGFGANSFRY